MKRDGSDALTDGLDIFVNVYYGNKVAHESNLAGEHGREALNHPVEFGGNWCVCHQVDAVDETKLSLALIVQQIAIILAWR